MYRIPITVKIKRNTVEPALSGHPRGMGKCCKKNISNKVSAEKTFDFKLDVLIFGVLMICTNKQENQLLHLER